jgi:adenosylcobyric acid synthase
MLGQRIDDPDGIESAEGSIEALGLLPHTTEYRAPKRTRQRSGYLSALAPNARVNGFELHHGRMVGALAPLVTLDDGTPEGSLRGAIMASMLHRLFDDASARSALLDWLRRRHQVPTPSAAGELRDPYDALADHVQAALDWPKLRAIALGLDATLTTP